jgi:adenylate cyclase
MLDSTVVSRLLDALYRPVADPGDDDRTRLKKSLVMLAASGGAVMTLGSAFLMGRFGAGTRVVLVLVGYAAFIFAAMGYVVVRRSGYDVAVTLLLALNLATSGAVTFLAGGLQASGANALWGIVAPVIALMVYSRRVAAMWFVAFLAMLVVAVTVPSGSGVVEMSRAAVMGQFAVNLIGISIFMFFILLYFIAERDKAQHQVEVEQARSDLLLRNVLPDEIVDRLRSDPTIIADHVPAASVLFADIADFTPMSARLGPADLVAMLNEAFSEFDRLVVQHGVEKIKTIGDCYMAAAGVPVAQADHAGGLAELALGMQRVTASRAFGGHRLQFRIGINSGPLVAGVIGERRFIYDLWGDTVNVASRMESHGLAGRIQVTEATRALLDDRYRFTDRGEMEVKGRGPMRTYFLEARVPEAPPV